MLHVPLQAEAGYCLTTRVLTRGCTDSHSEAHQDRNGILFSPAESQVFLLGGGTAVSGLGCGRGGIKRTAASPRAPPSCRGRLSPFRPGSRHPSHDQALTRWRRYALPWPTMVMLTTSARTPAMPVCSATWQRHARHPRDRNAGPLRECSTVWREMTRGLPRHPIHRDSR